MIHLIAPTICRFLQALTYNGCLKSVLRSQNFGHIIVVRIPDAQKCLISELS